jgi:hypothetical protein
MIDGLANTWPPALDLDAMSTGQAFEGITDNPASDTAVPVGSQSQDAQAHH